MSVVIGVDYGTDSVRSVIVSTKNGKELSSGVFFILVGKRENTVTQQPINFDNTLWIMLKD